MDVDLLGKPPKADILLLRREGEAWNAAQRARLPDGVRDSAAAHVLVEFKYTESVNETALAYDHFYRQGQRLSEEQALTVLLSARTPRKDRLEKWGYEEEQKGVFCSQLPLLRRVRLLVLNRLPPQPHNAFVKLFASRKREREAAFASLDAPTVAESPKLHAYMVGLQTALGVKGEVNMAEMLTPEKVMEIGEKVRQRILEMASPEERLAGLDPNESTGGHEYRGTPDTAATAARGGGRCCRGRDKRDRGRCTTFGQPLKQAQLLPRTISWVPLMWGESRSASLICSLISLKSV